MMLGRFEELHEGLPEPFGGNALGDSPQGIHDLLLDASNVSDLHKDESLEGIGAHRCPLGSKVSAEHGQWLLQWTCHVPQ